MHRLPTILFATVAMTAPVAAKTVALPDGKPVMTAFLPDAWKPADTSDGVEAQSPDGDIYVSIEFARDGKHDFIALMNANGDWMKDNKIIPDTPPASDMDLTVNGIRAHEITYAAHDPDGPTNVVFTVYELPRGALALVTVWGSTKERSAHEDQIERVLTSIQPID